MALIPPLRAGGVQQVLHQHAGEALGLRRLDAAEERLRLRSKQRHPNPKDDSLIRKQTSTYKGFHSTFAALFSY